MDIKLNRTENPPRFGLTAFKCIYLNHYLVMMLLPIPTKKVDTLSGSTVSAYLMMGAQEQRANPISTAYGPINNFILSIDIEETVNQNTVGMISAQTLRSFHTALARRPF